MKKMKLPKVKNGFTLIELLVTITIIAIVSAVVVPGLRNFNRGQDLQVAKGMLFDGLRLSQSKANASIVCPNVEPRTISLEINWSVVLRTDRFSLDYRCVDRSVSIPQTHTGTEDRIYPSATSIVMASNSCTDIGSTANNTRIEFSSRTCPAGSTTCRTFQITCGDGTTYDFVNGPFNIRLRNDQLITTTLSISAGGAIYESVTEDEE